MTSRRALKVARQLSGCRTRCVREAMKLTLSEELAHSGKCINGSAATRVEGIDNRSWRDWNDAKMVALQIACVRCLGGATGTFSPSEDAATLGCPAREMKSFSFYHTGLHVACWSPNPAPKSTLCWVSKKRVSPVTSLPEVFNTFSPGTSKENIFNYEMKKWEDTIVRTPNIELSWVSFAFTSRHVARRWQVDVREKEIGDCVVRERRKLKEQEKSLKNPSLPNVQDIHALDPGLMGSLGFFRRRSGVRRSHAGGGPFLGSRAHVARSHAEILLSGVVGGRRQDVPPAYALLVLGRAYAL